MIKEKIIATVGKRKNKNFSGWYQVKVYELADFFLKKAHEEQVLIAIQQQEQESCQQYELEVIAQ